MAPTEDEARRLVALNVPEVGAQAKDASLFTCEVSTEKTAPADMTYRRFSGPIRSLKT